MASVLTEAEMTRLCALISRRSGLRFPKERWPFLQSRVRMALARSGAPSGRQLLEELEAPASGPRGVYTAFERTLHVHETGFFRYPEHHRFLAEVALPELAARPARSAEADAPIRIWSVGCATGEEPYSIAMTLGDHGAPAGGRRVEIVAVDVSAEALAVGERGHYSEERVVSVPTRYRGRYLMRAGRGFTVVPVLRELVRFLRHDVRRGLYLGRFDLIFCCNLLLYFGPSGRRAILRRLAESLARGGYLFLGHADGATPPASWFARRRGAAGFVYQRI